MSGEKFYHCSFIFAGVPKMRDLEPAFADAEDDWIRLSPFAWIIWTPKLPNLIHSRVLPLLDAADNFIITEMNPYWTIGKMQPWVWSWINSKAPNAVAIYDLTLPPPPKYLP